MEYHMCLIFTGGFITFCLWRIMMVSWGSSILGLGLCGAGVWLVSRLGWRCWSGGNCRLQSCWLALCRFISIFLNTLQDTPTLGFRPPRITTSFDEGISILLHNSTALYSVTTLFMHVALYNAIRISAGSPMRVFRLSQML